MTEVDPLVLLLGPKSAGFQRPKLPNRRMTQPPSGAQVALLCTYTNYSAITTPQDITRPAEIPLFRSIAASRACTMNRSSFISQPVVKGFMKP